MGQDDKCRIINFPRVQDPRETSPSLKMAATSPST